MAAVVLAPIAATVWVAWRSLSPPRQGAPDPALLTRYRADTVTFESSGRILTAYRVDPGRGASRGVVLLVHGWGSSAADMLPHSEFLSRAGWSSLAIDLRGHGPGKRETTVTLPGLAEDVAAAWEWMNFQEAWRDRPRALLGHSMGAAASLYAVTRLHLHPGALVLASAFARMEATTEYVLRKWKIPPQPFGRLVQAVWKQRTGLELKSMEPEVLIGEVDGPLLVTHGGLDPVTSPKAMQRLLLRAPTGTESVEIPGAAHSDLAAFPEYSSAVVSFLDRYL